MMTEQQRQAIDLQAIQCCRKMTDTERASFFATTLRDASVGHCYSGQRFPEYYMAKGPAAKQFRTGMRREVYSFDAQEISRLWQMVMPFIKGWVVAVTKRRENDPDCQDIISAVLEDLTYTLRFEGPVPRNKSFTYALNMALKQVVNDCLKQNASPSVQMLRQAVSLSESEAREEDENDGEFALVQDGIADGVVVEEMMFGANTIADDLVEPVGLMLGGESLYQTAGRRDGMTRSQIEMEARRLRREVSRLVSDDGEPIERKR